MAPQALSYDYPVPRNLPDLTFTPFLEILEKNTCIITVSL